MSLPNKIFQIVPNTVPRLVQVVDNQFYDGDGNPLVFQGPQGPLATPDYKYQTSSYFITPDDYFVEAVGTFDIYLPTAIDVAGKTYLIKNSGTGEITINPTASQLIDNLPSYDLAFYDTLVVISNGTNWSVENSQTKTYTRVYNNTGSIIPKGAALKIQSTYNGIPAVTLPIASGTGSQQVIGLSLIDIPIASEGIAISAGILSGLNLASYSVGDILYLSDYVAGGFVNSTESLLYSSRTNQIGYVTSNSSTIGTIQVQINNEDINLSLTDIQRNILEGNVISGGIFQFPAPGITISSPTTLDFSYMKGWIVDNAGPTTSIAPIVTLVEYPGATGVSLSNITTATETYFLVNSSGVLTQQTTFPTPRQRRENIYLGKAGHANKSTIANAFSEPDIDVSPAAQVRDMFTPIKLINDGVYPSYVGANLTFQTSAGNLWGLGIGYTTDVLNPSNIPIPATSPTTFQYRTKAGGTYSNTTLIDPGFYDVAGVRTAVGTPAKQATNQRIFLIQNGIFRVQYGQTKYADLTTALENVQNEVFDTFVNFRDNGILIGILSVVSNATNLSDPTQARFLFVSKFGETVGAAGGISTTTLQQAYNNSAEPEIVTNSILDGITFKRGSAADTDNVFVVQNGSASNTFYVTGDGHTTTQTLTIPNIGLTSGATRYMVVDTSGNTYYQTTNGLPDGDPIRFLGGATAFSFGSPTISVWGNLIPSQNYTYDLGSTSSRWNNLYVKDVFAASQSIYLGDLKLTNFNGQLYVNGSVITGGGTGSGAQGPQGFQGITGPQGTNGTIGVNGVTGSQGPTGPQGFQGVQGPQGPDGFLGPTGPTNPAMNLFLFYNY